MDSELFRKTRRSYNTPGHAHELTFTTYKKARVLIRPKIAEAFLRSLDEARQKHDFDLWAYVVMPEHCHLLIRPRQAEYSVSQILSAIKMPTTSAAFAAYPDLSETMVVTREGRPPTNRLWLPGGGYDRNILSAKAAWNCINYIHGNPHGRELAATVLDWPWSSAGAYHGQPTPIPVDLCNWDK